MVALRDIVVRVFCPAFGAVAAVLGILGCGPPAAERTLNTSGHVVAAQPESRKASLLLTVLANRAEFAQMLVDEARLPYVDATAERVKSLRDASRPTIVGIDDFAKAIALSRVVFLSDVHGDAPITEGIRRAVEWLQNRPASVGEFGYVGFEFLYDSWADIPAADVGALVASEFRLDATGSGLTAWLLGQARSRNARVVPLNDPPFHSRSCLDENGLQGKYFWHCFTGLIRQRDRWGAERLNRTEGRGIVVYGRAHVVSGNLPQLVPRSCSVITGDPELWELVAAKIDCSTLSADVMVVVELAPCLFLVHFP